MTKKDERGFTLIELLVVIVIIGILAAMALPNFVKAREKALEAEVKSNIHSIQVALERYAVESGGTYPLVLYGGDNTDTFTTRNTPNYLDSSGTEQEGVSEFDGDVDVLLEYGFIAQYPRNPFMRRRNVEKYGRLITQPEEYNLPTLQRRVNIWTLHPSPSQGNGSEDRALQNVERQVGGDNGNLMWDLSEGQRHSPFPIVKVPAPDAGDPNNHYGYTNPSAPGVSAVANFRDDHLFFLMPGNFYYYATFAAVGGYNSFVNGDPTKPVTSEVVGFNLAGYGSVSNPAKDVYNIMGDYPDRSLFTVNNPNIDFSGLTLADRDKLYVGPDGRNDGVIIVVQSGSDRKTAENLEQGIDY